MTKMFELKVDPANLQEYHLLLDMEIAPLVRAVDSGGDGTRLLAYLKREGATYVGEAIRLEHWRYFGRKSLYVLEAALARVGVGGGWPTLGWQPPRKPPPA